MVSSTGNSINEGIINNGNKKVRVTHDEKVICPFYTALLVGILVASNKLWPQNISNSAAHSD